MQHRLSHDVRMTSFHGTRSKNVDSIVDKNFSLKKISDSTGNNGVSSSLHRIATARVTRDLVIRGIHIPVMTLRGRACERTDLFARTSPSQWFGTGIYFSERAFTSLGYNEGHRLIAVRNQEAIFNIRKNAVLTMITPVQQCEQCEF